MHLHCTFCMIRRKKQLAPVHCCKTPYSIAGHYAGYNNIVTDTVTIIRPPEAAGCLHAAMGVHGSAARGKQNNIALTSQPFAPFLVHLRGRANWYVTKQNLKMTAHHKNTRVVRLFMRQAVCQKQRIYWMAGTALGRQTTRKNSFLQPSETNHFIWSLNSFPTSSLCVCVCFFFFRYAQSPIPGITYKPDVPSLGQNASGSIAMKASFVLGGAKHILRAYFVA